MTVHIINMYQYNIIYNNVYTDWHIHYRHSVSIYIYIYTYTHTKAVFVQCHLLSPPLGLQKQMEGDNYTNA